MMNIGLKIIYQLIFYTSLQALAFEDFFARHHQIIPEKTNIFSSQQFDAHDSSKRQKENKFLNEIALGSKILDIINKY